MVRTCVYSWTSGMGMGPRQCGDDELVMAGHVDPVTEPSDNLEGEATK